MKNIVLLGGNGYLGRNFIQNWLKHDQDSHFYVLSRSGKNSLASPVITNLQVDVTDQQAVLNAIPSRVNLIVDFVGAPSNDPQEFKKLNQRPAQVMRAVAEERNVRAMGFIGGTLGPKKFTSTKKELIKYLRASPIPLAYVEPTLVYGAGRKDKMTRNVPLLKFLGIFSAKFKPVLVGEVVEKLRQQLISQASD